MENEPNKLAELKAETINSTFGNLTDGNCDICHNKGYIAVADGISVVMRKCECMARRENLKRMKKSGLLPVLEAYTLSTYKADNKWQEQIKQGAIDFLNEYGKWFVVCGTPGSGKTHICTAICSQLMNVGKSVRYMLWRNEAPKLKALVNDRDSYEREMNGYKTADVLYIDDFFKGNITEADINLAFELINDRYNDRRKTTIISGERTINELIKIDEAIGSRIYERSKGFYFETPKGANYRMRD